MTPMTPMTPQEVFDKTVTELAEQRVPALDNKEGRRNCRYRDRHGNACAAGVHIPDERYDPKIEGMSVLDLCIPSVPLNLCDLPAFRHGDLLHRLQSVHDHIALENGSVEFDPKRFHAAFGEVARNHGLNLDALNKAVEILRNPATGK